MKQQKAVIGEGACKKEKNTQTEKESSNSQNNLSNLCFFFLFFFSLHHVFYYPWNRAILLACQRASYIVVAPKSDWVGDHHRNKVPRKSC